MGNPDGNSMRSSILSIEPNGMAFSNYQFPLSHHNQSCTNQRHSDQAYQIVKPQTHHQLSSKERRSNRSHVPNDKYHHAGNTNHQLTTTNPILVDKKNPIRQLLTPSDQHQSLMTNLTNITTNQNTDDFFRLTLPPPSTFNESNLPNSSYLSFPSNQFSNKVTNLGSHTNSDQNHDQRLSHSPPETSPERSGRITPAVGMSDTVTQNGLPLTSESSPNHDQAQIFIMNPIQLQSPFSTTGLSPTIQIPHRFNHDITSFHQSTLLRHSPNLTGIFPPGAETVTDMGTSSVTNNPNCLPSPLQKSSPTTTHSSTPTLVQPLSSSPLSLSNKNLIPTIDSQDKMNKPQFNCVHVPPSNGELIDF